MVNYFEEIETEEPYDGYFYSIAENLTVILLGSMCGLKNVKQIQQWAESDKVREYLKETYAIERIPCYFWMLTLLKMVKPESLSRCISKWAEAMMPEKEKREGITIAVDGKTIRSTEKMKAHTQAMHIISAQLSEYGLTIASRKTEDKTNEIPEVPKLLKEMDIAGCLVVADALNCQKETARVIVEGEGDYLLSAKANQLTLAKEIEEYVQDEELRGRMEMTKQTEKNRGRIETRTAYVTTDFEGMSFVGEWEHLICFGAIHKESIENGKKTDEWHYYISSRLLTPEKLLHHARMEWTVETMHWLLDVHFREDYFRVVNATIQENMNLLRKFVINLIKTYKTRSQVKRPISNIMLACLLDASRLNLIFDA